MDVTLNDVVLAVCSGALRRYLLFAAASSASCLSRSISAVARDRASWSVMMVTAPIAMGIAQKLGGLPALAVGWWASGPWPGAAVVENREVLARSRDGRDVDGVAIAEFEKLSPGRSLSAVYLAGADILRGEPLLRDAAVAGGRIPEARLARWFTKRDDGFAVTKELRESWVGWHAIAPPLRQPFERYVALANKGARDLVRECDVSRERGDESVR